MDNPKFQKPTGYKSINTSAITTLITQKEQPQSMMQWNRMMYQRKYRQSIKDYRESKEYREQVKANETIWIKKSNIIYGDKSY